jgi:cytochrome c peroxidase
MKYIYILGILLFLIGCNSEPTTEKININTKIELGEKLFFDPILSLDNSISCASCHQPEFAFADNKPFSVGVNDSLGTRNTPSVMNMLSRPFFFHDGRAASLEAQAVMPVENPVEMNLSFTEAVKRITENKEYFNLFNRIYQTGPNTENITNALAEFQRSLESDGSAPHDLWMNDTDTNALSISQQRGREIFLSPEFKCFDCHFGPDFTGDEFRNIGLFDNIELLDKGRFDVTQDSNDIGKFKTPGLRNIALTAPYMHNGMFNTLEEVIDFYSNPYDFVENPINMDSLMVEPLNLSDQQKTDLVNFLHSLTDKNIPHREKKL